MIQNVSEIESQLLVLTRQFLLEQDTQRAIHAISLDASLERQLGIDSLGKVELFHRIEKAYGIVFSDAMIAQSDTLRDIAKSALTAKPSKKYKQEMIIPIGKQAAVDLNKVTTLSEVLIEYAVHEPDRDHIYLQDEDGNEEIITYGQLLSEAASVANALIELGIKPDDTVAIMLPTDKQFFPVFFGVLLTGAIPAPIYPPFRADRLEEYTIREAKILNNAEVRVLITFAAAELLSRVLKIYVPSLKAVVTAANLLKSKSVLPKIHRTADHAALLQYTSGSTGDPKGVLLLHRNILANIKAAGVALQITASDVLVSWLPLYHDMGLMSWLGSLYFGISLTILSPLSFLNRPERWLWAIHYHRATLSAAPNFAYELCVKKIEEAKLEGLDLSSWRVALNGAEAINPATLTRFQQRFKKYGFKEATILPVYGLAENTVGLSFPKLGTLPRIDRIDRAAFEEKLQAIPTTQQKKYLEFICEGSVIAEHEIRITDPTGNSLPERHIGNVEFRGPSAMQGYYRNPQATAAANNQGWWITGDLGYIADKELFIAGRKKDLIIKAGRNLYPEVFEAIASDIAGVRKGCVAAFGVIDSKLGTEKIIIVVESKLITAEEQEQLRQTILEEVTIGTGVPPDEIVLAQPKMIPKTSSGKLQRSACKQAYLDGELIKKRKNPQWHLITVVTKAVFQYLKGLSKKAAVVCYNFYAWFMISITFIPIAILGLILPRKPTAIIFRFWSRMIFPLIGCPIHIIQTEKFSNNNSVIFTVNHSSYTDALILLAVLPSKTVYIGKKELFKVPILATFFKKLDVIAIDRWDFSQNLEDIKKMKAAIENNHSVVIFPEGTFSYASGLRPFKSGAFQLAVDMQTPICPVALKGTRKLLRAGSWLLTPQKLTVTFSNSVIPSGTDWQEVTRLRLEVRKVISQQCGEPIIDILVPGPER